MKFNVVITAVLCTVLVQAAPMPQNVAQVHEDFKAINQRSSMLERRMDGTTSMKIVAAVAAGLSWPFYLIGGSLNSDALNRVSKTQNLTLMDMQLSQFQAKEEAARNAKMRAGCTNCSQLTRPTRLFRRDTPLSAVAELAKSSKVDTGLTIALLTSALGNLAVATQSMWNGYHNDINSKEGLRVAQVNHERYRYAQNAMPDRMM